MLSARRPVKLTLPVLSVVSCPLERLLLEQPPAVMFSPLRFVTGVQVVPLSVEYYSKNAAPAKGLPFSSCFLTSSVPGLRRSVTVWVLFSVGTVTV